MNLYYRSYSDLSAIISKNFDIIAGYNFDLIVGIPRSGMIPAYMIALFLNTNCCSFSELYMNQKLVKYGSRTILDSIDNPQDAKRILIIEDSYDKGERLMKFIQSLPNKVRAKCIVAAVYSAVEMPWGGGG
jgi:hypoxanthine phosphoribosyltransferase